MHNPARCLIAAAVLTIQACADTSFEAKDTWTTLPPTTGDMSVIGANWLPSAEQVVAAREAARQRIAQDAKALPPVGREEWRLRDARDILQHWNSYRLQAWGYTKHHKKLIR